MYSCTAFAANIGCTAVAQKQKRSTVSFATRQLWAPGAPIPSYLDGSLAGDFGFDPLGLARDPRSLSWMVQAELVNGRFAMLGMAGILIPSLLTKIGAGNFPIWYEAGEVSAKSSSIPTGSLIAVEAVLIGFAEIKRWQEWRKPGSQSEPGAFLGLEGFFKGTGDPSYPGGVFDPMGMSKGSDAQFAELKLKEVKNGRLAMLAFLGCWCQYVATKKSPMDNLFDHLSNPTYNNFATNGISTPDFTKTLLPAYVHAH